MRKVQFKTEEYYHIYNRGVDKREIFLDDMDFVRFIRSMREFNVEKPIGSLYEKDFKNRSAREKLNSPLGIEFLNHAHGEKESNSQGGIGFNILGSGLVEIIYYCLNPNHYHLVVKQLVENGITKFMHKLGLGYTNYFNKKHKRSGALFQGKFKAKHIDSAKYLAWLSGYVNGNIQIHKLNNAKSYQWSSYQDYLGIRTGTLCNKNIVLEQFNNNIKDYQEFVEMVVNDSQEKKKAIKEYLSELE